MDQNNLRRIKNILDGDLTGHTKIISGYNKNNQTHEEGDIWEEGGKTWTIKDGIKQNITKLDDIRKLINMPFNCPHCGRPMKKRLDKKFWQLKGKCFDCIVEADNEMIIDGTFVEHTKEEMAKNISAFETDIKEQVVAYIESIGAKHFITEMGDIEEWIGGKSKEEWKDILDKKIEKFKELKDESGIENTTGQN